MVKVDIFSGETLIGSVELLAADPPMGVAAGVLIATEAYRNLRPLIDALNMSAAPNWDELALRAVMVDGREVYSAGGIWIADLLDLEDEPPEVHLLGIGRQQGEYEALFGTDPGYLSYYGSDE